MSATTTFCIPFQQQDYKQAERFADTALTNDRYNPNALVNKGNVCYARGEYDKAREFYREAFTNEASCVEALFNLGEGLLWMRWGPALGSYGCDSPSGSLQHAMRTTFSVSGLTSKKMGKLDEALDCFHKLHNILRNNAQVLYQIGSM